MAGPLTPLGKLLQELASDPKALSNYRRNPGAALKAAGLSPVEEDAMKSKDPGRIRAALGGLDPAEQKGLVIINANTIVLVL